jgi:hypothetical protein
MPAASPVQCPAGALEMRRRIADGYHDLGAPGTLAAAAPNRWGTMGLVTARRSFLQMAALLAAALQRAQPA